MALVRLYSVRCDGCGNVRVSFSETPRRARHVARHDGWVSVSGDRDGSYGAARLDYCPQCVDAGKDSAPDA